MEKGIKIRLLAFPAREKSGRPAFAVTQDFLFANDTRMSMAVQYIDTFSTRSMFSRQVRLSVIGGSSDRGWGKLKMSSSGRSWAA